MKHLLLITVFISCTYSHTADDTKKKALEFFSTLKPVIINREPFEQVQQETYDKLYRANIEKPGKTLIVGSIRADKSLAPDFANALWGNVDTDFSFQGKDDYITIDIKPAKNPGRHIVGNATTHTIKEENVRMLYFARPWTYQTIKYGASEDDYSKNVIEQSIRNHLPALRSGGQVLIEWQAYAALKPYDENDSSDTFGILEQEDRIKNPFTTFFDGRICKIATFLATQTPFPKDKLPSHWLPQIEKLCEPVSKLLDFYANQHVYYGKAKKPLSRADFDTHLRQEVMTIGQMGEELSPEQEAYITESVFAFLWSDMGTRTNALLAIRCLQKLGLENVRFWRGISPVNGRKNVWLLSGFKK